MIQIECIICKKELNENGALFIGTPDELGRCSKLHICANCEGPVSMMFLKLMEATV